MNATTYTPLEMKVAAALFEASSYNGHDFGLLDEVKVKGMNKQALGALITTLQTKGFVQVHGRDKSTGFWIQQFTLTDVNAAAALLGEPAPFAAADGWVAMDAAAEPTDPDAAAWRQACIGD